MIRREATKVILAALGAALSPSILRALERSGEASKPLSVQPVPRGKFNDQQAATVAAMAERIIPTTDTPGAITAGVPAFIEEIVFAWYTETERNIFFQGLTQSESFSYQQFGKTFVELQVELQDVVLRQMEVQGGASPVLKGFDLMPNLDEDKKAFFPKLKELVVVGYYTSEVGATQELRYLPMPMAYRGDVPLDEQPRNWASTGFLD